MNQRFTKKIRRVLLCMIFFLGLSSMPALAQVQLEAIWLAGDTMANYQGHYGTKGLPSSRNKPGGRQSAVSWVDATGYYLWGGWGYASGSSTGYLNDLWRWDGTNWTWLSGDTIASPLGDYGIKGVAASTNKPSGRELAVSWRDASGNVYIFGGFGKSTSHSTTGNLNDLWRWDGTNWTWISGSTDLDRPGRFGAQGVAAPNNVPGSRRFFCAWTDVTGDTAYIFGGYGRDENNSLGRLNDLWRWDGTNWTWMSGSRFRDPTGNYGVKGVAASTNMPGSRQGHVAWRDASGDAYIFSGYGSNNTSQGYLRDLWKWDGTYWTWVSGDLTLNQGGNYGTQGVAAATNLPGSRQFPAAWVGASGDLYLLGGYGRDKDRNAGQLTDLWKWDGTNWTWESGDAIREQRGVYGTRGVYAPSNKIPGRQRMSVAVDNGGNAFLFGGYGYNGVGSILGRTSDLWRMGRPTCAAAFQITACDSFVVPSGDETYYSSGLVLDTIPGTGGCDSVMAINLTILHSTTGTHTVTACDSYVFNGMTYTASNNTAKDTLTNAAGCDSIITLDLTITHPTTGTYTVTACDSYVFNGITYTASNNTAKDTLTNAAGCDSIITLDLTITHPTTGTHTVTACDSYVFNGMTYTASNNTAKDTLTSAAGCDSIITLDLTIIQPTTGTYTVTACDSYVFNGITYTASNNTAKDTLTSAAGCDSIVTLDLTINTVSDITTTLSGTTITANNTNATYQWLDCKNNNTEIAGATNQTYTATASGEYTVELTENSCVDTATCVAIASTAGIAESSFEGQLRVYPNPTQGEVTLDFGKAHASITVTVYDIHSRLVQTQSFSHADKVNISLDQPKGVYFVHVASADEKAIIRLIKE